VLLILGVAFLVFGISDLVVAGVLARKEAAATGGLGGAEAPVAARVLKLSGLATLVAGVVLVVIGLAS
jgi:hypothetical protein